MCSIVLANTNVSLSSKIFHISIVRRSVPDVFLLMRIALVVTNATTGLLPLLRVILITKVPSTLYMTLWGRA